MKHYFTLLLILFLLSPVIHAQDTFSIVAIDTLTGEIGSAGASCIDDNQITGGAIIISDILPGRGAIHTQAYWLSTNQQHAHDRMVEGLSPQEIIDWLEANDAQNNPTKRQYGIVDMDADSHPRSAAFTGINCDDYKNHIVGPNYSIQGNILLGQEVLDNMEQNFLNAEGSLAEKLMATLQGAKMPGADTRCTSEGVSSLSAFIRVAWPSDTNGVFYLDLNVPSTPYGVEPIDSLQVLFNEWQGIHVGVKELDQDARLKIYPNPAVDWIVVESRQSPVGSLQSAVNPSPLKTSKIMIYNSMGQLVDRIIVENSFSFRINIDLNHYPAGMYSLVLCHHNHYLVKKFSVIR